MRNKHCSRNNKKKKKKLYISSLILKRTGQKLRYKLWNWAKVHFILLLFIEVRIHAAAKFSVIVPGSPVTVHRPQRPRAGYGTDMLYSI